jgi:hypothetical protein
MTALKAEQDDKPKRRHRSPHGPGWFVTDQELIECMGVPPDTARNVLAELDRDTLKNFPRKQKLWGDRRYLPAVQAWFERIYGLKLDPQRRDRHDR